MFPEWWSWYRERSACATECFPTGMRPTLHTGRSVLRVECHAFFNAAQIASWESGWKKTAVLSPIMSEWVGEKAPVVLITVGGGGEVCCEGREAG